VHPALAAAHLYLAPLPEPEPERRPNLVLVVMDDVAQGGPAAGEIDRPELALENRVLQMIAEAALQEDVDVVGLSILSGAHMTLCPKVVDLLRAQGQEDVPVLVGGIIPDDDAERLRAAGIAAIFGPGTSSTNIVDFIRTMSGQSSPSTPQPA